MKIEEEEKEKTDINDLIVDRLYDIDDVRGLDTPTGFSNITKQKDGKYTVGIWVEAYFHSEKGDKMLQVFEPIYDVELEDW